MVPEPESSSDQFQRLVELVYEGPLESRPWESFLRELRCITGDRAAAITLHHPDTGGMDSYVMAAAAEDCVDWGEAERIYAQEHLQSDPARVDLLEPGRIVVTDASNVAPSYGEFLRARGIAHFLRMMFVDPGGMRAWLDVIRACDKQPFTSAERLFFGRLLPHLERALKLYAALMRSEIARSLYEETVDHFIIGAMLLDGHGEIIHSNAAGNEILAARTDIRIRNRRIFLQDAIAQQELDDAVAAISRGRDLKEPAPTSRIIKIGGATGSLLGLLVRPVPLAIYYRGDHAPHVIVYFSDLARRFEAFQPSNVRSQNLVAKLFGLTRQQARLALLMADGCTLSEAAVEMHVSERTARNYSIDIYQRMDIKRQADLVRIIHRCVALLR